jgi:hypothetical protein
MECIPRVFLTDALTDERSALRLTLLDLEMEIAGEAAGWPNMYSVLGQPLPTMELRAIAGVPGASIFKLLGIREHVLMGCEKDLTNVRSA